MALDLNILNPEQHKAVTTTEGPLLILAGAGSGKTRVLTYRIAYILEQKLAYPEQILAVTFTNKAAGEMKERIAALLEGQNVKLPWMGTFHSICVKILKRDGHYLGIGANFSIYDPGDQLDVVKEAMDRLNISKKDVNPNAVHNFISSAKNELVAPEDYLKMAQGYFQETVAEIYPLYQKILRENNALDFDDLLMYTVWLFQRYPEVLAKYQELFKYILVDEYQDTNHVQYLMITLLGQKYRNVCCVGDDDQSIYAFRGATIRNILNFERDYSEANVVKLEQNYRSTKTILEAAFEVVKKNKNRTDKKLWTENISGDRIVIYTAKDEQDEANWVVGQIHDLVNEGTNLEEIAVLYRTNAQSRSMEEGFIRKAVAYRIIGGQRFYERKEIKDILAYLRTIYNPQDESSLKRIINVPKRGIGPKAISDLADAARNNQTSILQYLLEDHEFDNKTAEFAKIIRLIDAASREHNIVDLINFILEQTKYIKMLDDGTSESEGRVENIKELISVAAKYVELEPAVGLTTFLDEVSLLEGQGQEDVDEDKVTLMTIHAAKGLEFKYVFVVGMEEGLFPHSRVFTDPTELEEERRLAYVAITRAKHKLFLVHADSRLYFGARQNNMVSRFVEDIPQALTERLSGGGRSGWEEWGNDNDDVDDWEAKPVQIEIKPGDRVKHEYFGVGTILKVDGSTVKINFGPVYGTKELSKEFAPLQKL